MNPVLIANSLLLNKFADETDWMSIWHLCAFQLSSTLLLFRYMDSPNAFALEGPALNAEPFAAEYMDAIESDNVKNKFLTGLIWAYFVTLATLAICVMFRFPEYFVN